MIYIMEEYLRIDYFFSYWIVVWFIIYYFIIKTNIIQSNTKTNIKNNFNPKLCVFIYLLFNKPTTDIIIKYVIMILVLKVIPLYLLQEEKIVLPKDLVPVSGLFIIYNVYIVSLNRSFYTIYTSAVKYHLKGSNQTPFFHLIQSLGSRFSSKSS
jgi:hypothetical protein